MFHLRKDISVVCQCKSSRISLDLPWHRREVNQTSSGDFPFKEMGLNTESFDSPFPSICVNPQKVKGRVSEILPGSTSGMESRVGLLHVIPQTAEL